MARNEAVLQVEHEDLPFAQIPHVTLRDKRLSLEARGLLCLLLSFPKGWEVRIRAFMEEYGLGRREMRRTFRLLRRLGYARLRVVRDARNGEFKGRRYIIRGIVTEGDVLGSSVNVGENNTSYYFKNMEPPAGKPAVGAAPSLDLKFRNGDFPPTEAGQLCKLYYQFLSTNGLLITKEYHGRTITIKPSHANWLAACEHLLKSKSAEDIVKVLRWYAKNLNNPFIRIYKSFTHFCHNFRNLEKEMLRDQRRRNGGHEERDIPRVTSVRCR